MAPKTKKRWLIGLSYVVFFIVVSQAASWWKSRHAPTGNLSDFDVVLMDGSKFALSAFEGEPVLLHFWSTWCPICDLEQGSIEAISKDYPVVTIASWSESREVVASYMAENELSFPVMLDNSGELAQSFSLKGVPASFILSPRGEISFVETGYTTEIGLRLRLWLSMFED